jgi:hypothetical protein
MLFSDFWGSFDYLVVTSGHVGTYDNQNLAPQSEKLEK